MRDTPVLGREAAWSRFVREDDSLLEARKVRNVSGVGSQIFHRLTVLNFAQWAIDLRKCGGFVGGFDVLFAGAAPKTEEWEARMSELARQ